MQTNAFDAQSGHTAGATVNLAIKSGTNALHWQTGYFNRDASRTETPLLTERGGGTKPTRTYNRFTGTVDGPIIKDRTFFMASFEHLRDVQPEPATYTVPTEKMRAGDFSEFSTQIFDPATATGSGRPDRLRQQQDRSEPDQPGRGGLRGALSAAEPARARTATTSRTGCGPYDYNAFMGRVDHNFTSAEPAVRDARTTTSARKIGTTGRRTRRTRPTTASSTTSP